MIEIRVATAVDGVADIALPVIPDGSGPAAALVPSGAHLGADVIDEVAQFLADVDHRGAAGTVHVLPRPGRVPGRVLLVGVGDATEAAWRSAGAGVVRAAKARIESITVHLPDAGPNPDAAPLKVSARAFAEGAWLASYRFRLASRADEEPKLRRAVLSCAEPASVESAVGQARTITEAVCLARDLTNMPSLQKSPAWFVDQVSRAAARRAGVGVRVLDERELAAQGFGGILAVGGGSTRPPRLLELSWRPRGASTHVVLVGKGITFDTGGYSIKPNAGMKLMRKDMGGAAAVCAALLGAAELRLPVRLTALAPLAENMISGSAYRPGDVVRHYGRMTTEVTNTDAEGRLVLADALAYASRRLRPDVLVDLATLTGASHVALGKRTAAVLSEDDALASALAAAGDEVGEPMWRLPLESGYLPLLASDLADLVNSPAAAEAGTITAALYLREFTGKLRDRWAHIDMSAPAWSDSADGPLVKGATGWGVRMLLRWLATVG